MNEMFDKISADIKTAMLAHDKISLETLRGIKKEFLEAKTAKGSDGNLSDDAAIKILQKMAKHVITSYSIHYTKLYDFPADKIIKTGNPVRQDLFKVSPKSQEAYDFFGFSAEKKTLLIVGGSLGARTINQSVIAHLDELTKQDIQIIWQTGKFYRNNFV